MHAHMNATHTHTHTLAKQTFIPTKVAIIPFTNNIAHFYNLGQGLCNLYGEHQKILMRKIQKNMHASVLASKHKKHMHVMTIITTEDKKK